MEKLVLPMPARFRVIGWVLLMTVVGVMALVAALAWRTPVVGIVALFAFPLWLILPLASGNRDSQLDDDGVLTRVYPRDRRRTRVPWSDVSAVWVAPIGRFRYLHVAVRDLDTYVVGRAFRRSVLQNLADTHGTPVLIYLPDDDEPALAAVERQGIPVLDARPAPEEKDGEPAPVPHRLYRAAPRNLLLPLGLLLLSAAVAWVAWAAGLISFGVIAFYLVLASGFLLVRLRGRTVLDESGFTVGRRRLPWSSMARVRFVTAGPLRSVQVTPHGGKPVVARGLVDQPLGSPRYAERVAEVKAACAGRVHTGSLRQSVLLGGAFVAAFPLFLAGFQFATVDAPWEDKPWWPGVDVATSTPDPCAALSTEDARRLVPDGDPVQVFGDPETVTRSCRRDGGNVRLDVDVRRETFGDVVAEARSGFRRTAAVSRVTEPVSGLGDEALAGGSGSRVEVVVRRGNVVIEVSLRSDAKENVPDREAVIAVARNAVAVVDLR
jgi:hypothetical protein